MKNVEDIYRLSPMQQGLLFHTLYAPASGVYFEQFSAAVRGGFQVAAFRRAWQRVVERHPILRTGFLWDGLEEPVQVVHQRVTLPFEEQDWRDVAESEQEARVEAFLEQDRRRGFDLRRPPLMRLAVLRLADDAWRFVWSFHHVLMDGWSAGIVVNEVMLFYSGLAQALDLLEQPRPFRDYIAWLQEQDLSQAETFWRERLRGFHAANSLPVAGLSRESPGDDCDRQQMQLSAETTERLRSLAARERLSMNTLVQGAWGLLLSRYSGDEDIVFGATSSGRPPKLSGSGSMVGLFVNTLPARLSVPPDARLLDWLRQLQAHQAEAREYEFSPLMRVRAWSEVPAGTPLFETIQVFENYPVDRSMDVGTKQASGVEVYAVRVAEKTNYPLSLMASQVDRQLSLRIMFDRDRFDSDTISRMLGHCRTLLEAMASGIDCALSEMPLLRSEERQRLLFEWNDTRAEFPAGLCVHQLIEQQVHRTPDAVALVYEGQRLTYRDLNSRANQLARHLRLLGVGPEVAVGIFMERGLELAIAALGILKAGGAFLPIDPAYPPGRLEFMLSDSKVPVLVTLNGLSGRLPGTHSRHVCLDSEWPAIERHEATDLPGRVMPDNLAYVIYTSGSTGIPKGALLTHRGLNNLASAQQRAFGLGPGSRVMQLAALSYDAAVWEFVMALTHGGLLCLAHRDHLLPGPALIHRLREEAITILTVSPSALAALPCDQLPDLETIVAAGERCTSELVSRWSGVQRFFNAYGPTESTVCATMQACRPGDLHSPSIGRPIDNTRVYILDRHLNELPAGVPGELHIGGAGLARAYHSHPDWTAERFIPDDLSGESGGRLYKSGDLCRWLPVGEIEFLGRIDDQVKLRGFRVEPGEVESTLHQHPAVHSAVVTCNTDRGGEKKLVGYVVADQGFMESLAVDRETQNARVQQWQALYEETYQQENPAGDPTFHIGGWVSELTGEPFPVQEMREWVDATADRILTRQPARVLELGCGSGLLLFRIAPHCESYFGTDISARALDHVRRNLSDPIQKRVRLSQREAGDWQGVANGEFDAVILNSVVQYFPGLDYLSAVLKQAVAAVAPGGFVFIGDVRNLALLEAFYTAVELPRAADSVTREQFLRRMEQRSTRESELAIAPDYFRLLPQQLSSISGVEILLKRGSSQNELTQFRYDVILHVGAPSAPVALPWLDWQADGLTLSGVRQRLAGSQPEVLALAGVPNARVTSAVRGRDLMASPDGPRLVGQLREVLATNAAVTAVDPEAIWALAEDGAYDLSVSWSAGRPDGSFDAVFRRRSGTGSPLPALTFEPPGGGSQRSNGYLATNPIRLPITRKLAAELRHFLQERLPEHMVPSVLMLLEALPLSPNGKVDRKSLPGPDGERPLLREAFVAPRTATEIRLQRIWRDVLSIDRIGVHDSFFDLGGHSLSAVRLIAEINKEFHAAISLADVFRAPTLLGVAGILDRLAPSSEPSPVIPLRPGGSKQPLFIVHGGGGFVLNYLPLARSLDPDRPVFGLQASGLDGEEPIAEGIGEMAARYVAAVRATAPGGPYLLAGHSFGGIVAYEMARQLREQNCPVGLLAILDCAAPHVLDSSLWEQVLTREMDRSGSEDSSLIQSIQGSNARHIKALRDFQPARYPGRITLVRTIRSHLIAMGQPEHGDLAHPDWGWNRLAGEPAEVHIVPADHFSMLREPYVRDVAAILRAVLEGADR